MVVTKHIYLPQNIHTMLLRPGFAADPTGIGAAQRCADLLAGVDGHFFKSSWRRVDKKR